MRTSATGATDAPEGTFTCMRPAAFMAITGRPSLSQPSGPTGHDRNALRLEVWALATKRAAWISSLNTTRAPRPRAAGVAATCTAARRFAGPSAPGRSARPQRPDGRRVERGRANRPQQCLWKHGPAREGAEERCDRVRSWRAAEDVHARA